MERFLRELIDENNNDLLNDDDLWQVVHNEEFNIYGYCTWRPDSCAFF